MVHLGQLRNRFGIAGGVFLHAEACGRGPLEGDTFPQHHGGHAQMATGGHRLVGFGGITVTRIRRGPIEDDEGRQRGIERLGFGHALIEEPQGPDIEARWVDRDEHARGEL